MSVITDTKMNGFGFTLLNIVSKGCFTFQMLHMVRWHRQREGRRTSAQEVAEDLTEEPWYVVLLRPYDANGFSCNAHGIPIGKFEEPMSSPLSKLEVHLEAHLARQLEDVKLEKSEVTVWGVWGSLPKEYRLFLEAAGIFQDEFERLDASTKVDIKLRYLEAYAKIKRFYKPISKDKGSKYQEFKDPNLEELTLEQPPEGKTMNQMFINVFAGTQTINQEQLEVFTEPDICV